ncbi:MAG: dihydroorotase, partial [Gammaproteobacteria bacterium]|nr:dihydroorotase [Gammaproteobacteria bacterium]
MRIKIANGFVIDPANNIEEKLDIYISEGRIAAIGKQPDGFTLDQTIDATDCHVIPGIVDLRARLREPGQENKGTIASETRAAAASGITTLCIPPDTTPVIDTTSVVELIQRRSKEAGYANIVTLAALTAGLKGEQLSEMATLKKQGSCVGVSNALKPVSNNLVMRRAMEYAASCGLTIFLHPEDEGLSGKGCAHEGAISTRLGLPGIPESAETNAVSRDLLLVEQTGVRAHFCHISSSRAAQMIARAQFDGLPVTADVTAQHLHLTEMDIGFFDSNCHVRPPLRTQRDREALIAALEQGNINAICSDHEPHDTDAKLAPFAETEAGISALETLLPLALRLTSTLSLSKVIGTLTTQPAKILGIDAGTLSVGEKADICIYNPETNWILKTENMLSTGRNTPFEGWEFKGKVVHTLLNGKVVYS